MAAIIRHAIDGGCTELIRGVVHNFGCASHLVTIDEVSPTFSNPATGGSGYAGRHLSQAMALLARTASPWGTSYAARVGIYVDAGVTVSIDVGHGRNHNLNARGRPQYAAFTDLMPGLARAGALWLEMYQGVRIGAGTAPFTPAVWRTLPGRFVGFLEAYGGNVARVHYMFGNAGAPTRSCRRPPGVRLVAGCAARDQPHRPRQRSRRIPARQPGRGVAWAVRQLFPVARGHGGARLVATCRRGRHQGPRFARTSAVSRTCGTRRPSCRRSAPARSAAASGPLQTRWLSAFSRWSFGLA